jgi:hypothetical protein
VAAALSGCADAGVTLDPDKWQNTVSDYLRQEGRPKALVLDLATYQSYWRTGDADAEAVALENCRNDGRLRCATAYRNNRAVLDVTPYLTPAGGTFSMADFAQVLTGVQAGLSGRPYIPPQTATGDAQGESSEDAVSPQTCLPNPPQCGAVGARARDYIANVEQRLRAAGTPAAGMAGMRAYCVNRQQAEVARICADEYAAQGLQSCASLARQQMEENLRVAEGARVTVGNLTSTAWRDDCNL